MGTKAPKQEYRLHRAGARRWAAEILTVKTDGHVVTHDNSAIQIVQCLL